MLGDNATVVRILNAWVSNENFASLVQNDFGVVLRFVEEYKNHSNDDSYSNMY